MTNLKAIVFSLMLAYFFVSCKEPYDPDVSSDQEAIVVEGLITNEFAPNFIRLTQALPYEGSEYPIVIPHAIVSITDDCGNEYGLKESSPGTYETNPFYFIGKPGNTYTLHIQTPDGNVYESNPEYLYPDNFAQVLYGEYIRKEELAEDYYGQPYVKRRIVTQVYCNIENTTDELARFRFETASFIEYKYSVSIPPFSTLNVSCSERYSSDFIVNLTDEKFDHSTLNVLKHPLYDLPAESFRMINRDSFHINAPVTQRITNVNRYRINNDTYNFYKNINSQLTAEGKMFDPAIIQFRGNIRCISDPTKIALGFFEVSSVTRNTYRLPPNKYVPEQIQFMNLPEAGCKDSITTMIR